jgi:hypothetical protein
VWMEQRQPNIEEDHLDAHAVRLRSSSV